MAEVVQELVAQSLALVRPRDEAGDVEELDGDASLAVDTSAVVGPTPVGDIVSLAGTVYL